MFVYITALMFSSFNSFRLSYSLQLLLSDRQRGFEAPFSAILLIVLKMDNMTNWIFSNKSEY